MYERFTDKARVVLEWANLEAIARDHTSIEPRLILWAFGKHRNNMAAGTLKSLGLEPQSLCEIIERQFDEAETFRTEIGTEEPSANGWMEWLKGLVPGPGRVQFNATSKQVIVFAMQEARGLGHDYIGTEHLLLGLLRLEGNPASEQLMELGINLERARSSVLKMLGQ